ncbi:MAG: hypothetical protein IPM63_11450 [Acidobacteriota bacterium]|nr:MAG: hypothetical protein IPM63_11450 [Acidobacteriota bacterium]
MGLLLGVLFFCVIGVPGQATGLPENNKDLQILLKKARTVQQIAARCADGDCPPLACETARRLNAEIVAAHYYAKYNYYWLLTAAKTHREVQFAAAESAIRDAERKAFIETIVAYQEYFVKISGAMLDLSSAAANIDQLLTDRAALGQMTSSEVIDRLDTIYEALNGLESAHRTMTQAQRGSTGVRMFSFDDNSVNAAKSTASDLKTIVQESIRNGRDWRTALSSSRSVTAIGQIVGRIAMNYAEREISERKRLADQLALEIAASEKVLEAAHRDAARIQERKFLAEDVYNAFNDLMDPNGRVSWLKCVSKLQMGCGQMDTIRRELRVPDHVQVTFYGPDMKLAVADNPGRWGQALQFLTPKMEELSSSFNSVSIKETEPALRISKSEFKAGETINVRFEAPSCVGPGSWIGIVKASVPHGSESTNSSNALQRDLIRQPTFGEKVFLAPDEAGTYSIRLNDTGSGRELTAASFEVVPSVDSGSPFQGVFRNPNGTYIGVKVEGGNLTVGFAERIGETNEFRWRENQDYFFTSPARIVGNTILSTAQGVCTYEDRSRWVYKDDVPFRLVFSATHFSFNVEQARLECPADYNIRVSDTWRPHAGLPDFFRASYDPPTGELRR